MILATAFQKLHRIRFQFSTVQSKKQDLICCYPNPNFNFNSMT